MAWTTPAAWNTGVVKDAAFWNAQVKANLEFLYGAPTHDCPSCGAVGLPEGYSFCGKCGASLRP